MQTLKIVLVTLVVSFATVAVAAAGLVYSGAYNVAATSKHWSATHWILEKTVHRSVDAQAAGITAPRLGAEEQLLAGATNFDAMCSGCHAPPGAKPSVAAQGMYPAPPELTHAAQEKSPAEIFWVIKHGIKASGMPAWGASHSDDDLWAMTAFVKQWPDMSEADYNQMLAYAETSGIGHHAGGGGHDESQADAQNDPNNTHDDGHGDDQGGGHHGGGNDGSDGDSASEHGSNDGRGDSAADSHDDDRHAH